MGSGFWVSFTLWRVFGPPCSLARCLRFRVEVRGLKVTGPSTPPAAAPAACPPSHSRFMFQVNRFGSRVQVPGAGYASPLSGSVHRRVQPIRKLSEREQIAFSGSLDLHHSSPDSSKCRFKTGDSKKAISSRSNGYWMDASSVRVCKQRFQGYLAYEKPRPLMTLQ